jgi:hypothetical protein
MDKSGIDALECKKLFDNFGKAILGARLATVASTTIESLQMLAKAVGESGVTVGIAERNDAHGMHPRLNSVCFAGADFPAADLQAEIDATGETISFGCATPAEEIMNLFFDLDVGRLPFQEAVRSTSAKRLAAASKARAQNHLAPGR